MLYASVRPLFLMLIVVCCGSVAATVAGVTTADQIGPIWTVQSCPTCCTVRAAEQHTSLSCLITLIAMGSQAWMSCCGCGVPWLHPASHSPVATRS
ncbi:hypothetical protein COO60DRAFT_1488754 [Scenedesmus sp. NREL 46B-D3]|nr:hypothetical protein COO60DRAFT_1488754 [Scenedesmus sp. NREL 46B-D3]